MKMNATQIERTLNQFDGQPIPPGHPAMPQLERLFGEHTYFLDGNGPNIVEPLEARARVGRSAGQPHRYPALKRRSNTRSPMGFCATTLAVAGLLFAPGAYAQDNSPSAPSTEPNSTTSPATIPDHKLDAAAAAVKQVIVVSDDFENKLAQAPADEKDRVLGEANVAITKAVTDQGLSVDEYMTIMTVAENDPVVRDKLLKRLE